NTLISTKVIATTAEPTSSIVLCDASRGESPSEINRSTFSTTTIASSTTIPIANTMPNNDRLLSENPIACMTANVPISDTGIATSGISVARHVCRKMNTTNTTRTAASNSVWYTAEIEASTYAVGL